MDVLATDWSNLPPTVSSGPVIGPGVAPVSQSLREREITLDTGARGKPQSDSGLCRVKCFRFRHYLSSPGSKPIVPNPKTEETWADTKML